MKNAPYDYGFGIDWNDICIYRREGYYTSVTDFHKHDFYEINLILSGNIKILLKDHFEEVREGRIVLARPGTQHYVVCNPDTLYSRLYLVFTEEFIANCFPEWRSISAVFGENGTIVAPTEAELAFFKGLIEQIEQEAHPFGKRLLVYYLLLRLSEMTRDKKPLKAKTPSYIFEALTYLEEHYSEKVNFTLLSKRLYVGRTTLMTEFKACVGHTMGEYLCLCRLKHVLQCLSDGRTLEYTAVKCGFSDSSGLIRAFKRHYKMTPHQYIKRLR